MCLRRGKIDSHPSTANSGVRVRSGILGLSKEPSHNDPDNPRQGVHGENVHDVVAPHLVLEPGAQVGHDGTDETDQSGRGDRDESGGRGNGDQTSNSAGAEPNHRPFPLEPKVHNHPDNRTDRSGEVGVENGQSGFERGGKARSTVETQPADPEEYRTEDDLRDVLGLEEDTFGPVVSPFTDKVRVGKTADTGSDFNGDAAGIVEHAPLVGPAVHGPDPVRQGVIDEGCPEKDKDHGGEDAGSFGDTAHHDCGHQAGKGLDVSYIVTDASVSGRTIW